MGHVERFTWSFLYRRLHPLTHELILSKNVIFYHVTLWLGLNALLGCCCFIFFVKRFRSYLYFKVSMNGVLIYFFVPMFYFCILAALILLAKYVKVFPLSDL